MALSVTGTKVKAILKINQMMSSMRTSIRSKRELGTKEVLSSGEIGPIELIVVQPTSFCNINCSYCYLEDRMQRREMSGETLHSVLKFILLNPYIHSSPHILWHSGEPLVVTQKFYQSAFAEIERLIAQQDRKILVRHSIQTNGTLLSQAWCDIFLQYSVHVGLSLDGPRKWHDSRRKTRSGSGTYDKVMQGLDLLVKNRVPFSVITVLSDESLQDADQLFRFFMENSVKSVGFNIEEITGHNTKSFVHNPIAEEKYKRFLRRFAELARGSELKVRELRTYKAKALGSSVEHTNQLVNPFSILSIDSQGNFGTFCPELLTTKSLAYPNGFTIGNVTKHSIDEAVQGPLFVKMHSEVKAGVERCRKECEYFDLCGGGAPSNKIFERGTFSCTETSFCRLTRKAVIDVTLDLLEAQLTRSAGSLGQRINA